MRKCGGRFNATMVDARRLEKTNRCGRFDTRTAAGQSAGMKMPLLIAFVVVAGCSSRPPAPEVTPVTEIPARGGWYCQPGLTPGTWDCVQDPQLAENPPPPRPIPVAPPPAPRPAPGAPVEPEDPNPTSDPFETLDSAPVAGAPVAGAPAEPPPVAAASTAAALPSDQYTIQLAAMVRQADLAPLLNRDDIGDAFVAEVESEGSIYHVLLLGGYDTAAAAREAIERLPEDLRALDPWVRPVASLKRAQAQAQRLATAEAP